MRQANLCSGRTPKVLLLRADVSSAVRERADALQGILQHLVERRRSCGVLRSGGCRRMQRLKSAPENAGLFTFDESARV